MMRCPLSTSLGKTRWSTRCVCIVKSLACFWVLSKSVLYMYMWEGPHASSCIAFILIARLHCARLLQLIRILVGRSAPEQRAAALGWLLRRHHQQRYAKEPSLFQAHWRAALPAAHDDVLLITLKVRHSWVHHRWVAGSVRCLTMRGVQYKPCPK